MLLSPSFLYVAHLFQLIPVALASDKNDVVLGQHNNNTAEIQL
jgi:heterodisulfide reductase subunit B